MQRILLFSGILCLAGCGSETSSPSGTVGIPLSISSQSAGSGNPGTPAVDVPSGAQRTAAHAGSSVDAGLRASTVTVLVQKADAAARSGQPRLAIEALSQAIGEMPEDAELYRMRADVYVMLKEMASARADFSTALRLSPDSSPLYNMRGYFLMTQGLLREARADFDEAIRLDSSNAPAWNNRGLVSVAAQKYDEALQDFSQAVEADRRYADGWNNRGFAKMKLNRSAEAVEDIRQAISIREDNTTAWNNLGLVYMQMERYDEAEKAFTRLIELSPMDTRWFQHRRAAYQKLEKFAEAQADAQQIGWLQELTQLTQQASAHAQDPRSWIQRAEHLMTGQQYAAAIQDFSRALTVNPGNTDALTGRAVAWLQAGDLQKAMQDCDEAIVAQATPRAYSVRADVWMMMKNGDQAIADLEAASRFDEKVAEAYEMRALQKQEAQQHEQAEADLKKAQEIRDALAGRLVRDDADAAPVPFPSEETPDTPADSP